MYVKISVVVERIFTCHIVFGITNAKSESFTYKKGKIIKSTVVFLSLIQNLMIINPNVWALLGFPSGDKYCSDILYLLVNVSGKILKKVKSERHIYK